jgi:hypothetical protein
VVADAAAVSAAAPLRRREHAVFFGFALLVTGLIVAGFFPTFFRPLANGELTLAPSVRLHGVLFFAWLALLLTQITLVATRNVRWHRRLGVAGVTLAAAMVVIGLLVALNALARDVAAGKGDEAKAFLIFPILDMILFPTLVGLAIAFRHRPDVHKRLMLLATLGLSIAGTFRLFQSVDPQGVWALVFNDALLLIPMLHDKLAYGRVHPVLWIGGGVLVAVHQTELWLGTSSVWMAIAERIAASVT